MHPVFGEARLLKLPINIAGEYPVPQGNALTPFAQNFKARVGNGFAIQVEPMAVEPPRHGRVPLECAWIGDIREIELRPGQGRVCIPEASIAAKVRKSGVDAHPGTRSDNQGIGLTDQLGSAAVLVVQG